MLFHLLYFSKWKDFMIMVPCQFFQTKSDLTTAIISVTLSRFSILLKAALKCAHTHSQVFNFPFHQDRWNGLTERFDSSPDREFAKSMHTVCKRFFFYLIFFFLVINTMTEVNLLNKAGWNLVIRTHFNRFLRWLFNSLQFLSYWK